MSSSSVDESFPASVPTQAPDFPTTHWTLVVRARQGGEVKRAALEELCGLYWYPIYAFLRRRGYSQHDAEDFTQGFFLKLLHDETFEAADGDKGQSLTITHARRFTGQGMTNSAWLRTLQFCDFLDTKLSDAGCRVLATCPRLAQVRIDGTSVTGEGLRALAHVRSLTHLSAGNCPNLTASNFASVLPEFSGLKDLELRHAAFADDDAGAVATLTNLTHLRLFSDKLSDTGLAKLSTLSRLKHLSVGDTSVTAGGIAVFTKLRPNCEVEN